VSSSAASTARATNLETVKALYAAFGRGDIPAILDMMSEDVQWEPWADSYGQRAGVPWYEARTGREGVMEFFNIVGTFDIAEFTVLDIMASENQVAAEIVIEAATPGGGRYRDEEMHLWSFDADGKISRMRHYTDTAKHIAAAQGEDTVSAA
jgi:ketosteroid isomerase-like protein